MTKSIEDPCVICGKSIAGNAIDPSFWAKGNNAQPVASGQCCDPCNIDVVLVRLRRVQADIQ